MEWWAYSTPPLHRSTAPSLHHSTTPLLHNLDHALFSALNRGAANSFLDWLMPRITNLHKEVWFAAVVLLGAAYFVWRGPRYARVWILCLVVAIGLSDLTARRVVKNLMPRERPCQSAGPGSAMAFKGVRLVPGEHCPGSPSFPSNHAANMGALAVICGWFTRRRTRWLWFLVPLIIGYSRVYLGYHYPSDVVGGWILGAAIGATVVLVLRRLAEDPERPETAGPEAEPAAGD